MQNIQFEERCVMDVFQLDFLNTVTYYFTAPKTMLRQFFAKAEYSGAEGMKISLTFPLHHTDTDLAIVSMSPVWTDPNRGYQWKVAKLPKHKIKELMVLAKNKERIEKYAG